MVVRKLIIAGTSAALTVGAAWLFHAPASAAATPVAARPTAPAPQLGATKSAVSAVAAPSVAPVTPKAPLPIAVAKPGQDPQAELNTSLSDMISLVQAGDLLTAFNRYMPPEVAAKMSPEQRDRMQQELSNAAADPQAQMAMQMMVTVLQGMQTQTPTMNDAGDRATYQVYDPSGQDPQSRPFAMRKIDGKWYIDPDSMGGL